MSRLGSTLPLHVFVHRQQVLHLYRNLLKGARRTPDVVLAASLKDQIRTDFKNGKNLKDKVSIKSAIVNGQKSLIRLDDLNGTNQGTTIKSGSWIDTKDDEDVRGRVGAGWPWG